LENCRKPLEETLSQESSAVLPLALRASVLVFVVEYQLALELVHRAAGLVDEAAQVASHLRELAGAEDHQKQQPDNDQLFPTYTEHAENIPRRPTAYNVFTVRRRFDRTYILIFVRRSGVNPVSESFVGVEP